jgi:ComF family protein
MPPVSAMEDRFLAPDPGVVVGEAFVIAIAGLAHRDEAQRLLRRLKYGSGRSVVEPLVTQILPAFERLMAVSGRVPLVPVPLHQSRERERGYNQAHLLAHELARQARLPVWPALVRRRATERQHALDRTTRMRNLRDAMAFRPPVIDGGTAWPAAVIVVDDILTTGATFEACASVLTDGGVQRVYGFAIAREV